jgi:hypothetical protein
MPTPLRDLPEGSTPSPVTPETAAIETLVSISQRTGLDKARICKRLAAAGLGRITKAKKGKKK